MYWLVTLFQMKSDTSPCIWPVFVPLFGDIRDGRDKKGPVAHMSTQPVSL